MLRAGTGQAAATRRVLDGVLERVVVPRLHARMPAAGTTGRAAVAVASRSATTRAAEDDNARHLADLVLGTLPADALEAHAVVVAAALAFDDCFDLVAERLLEPAARVLGDRWHDDRCTDCELTIALSRLQSLVHQRVDTPLPEAGDVPLPTVLVVPAPGERHLLCALLDAEALRHAGWNALLDFPPTGQALGDLLARRWVDALDLTLSPAFRREDRLAALGTTIAEAREASRNQRLVVVVSGRVFHGEVGELQGAERAARQGRSVGADASFGSSALACATITRVLPD